MTDHQFKRYILRGIKNDSIFKVVSNIFKGCARHNREVLRTPKGKESGALILETTASLSIVFSWYNKFREEPNGINDGVTLDVLPFQNLIQICGDPIPGDQLENLEEENSRLTEEISKLETLLEIKTNELITVKRDGDYFYNEQSQNIKRSTDRIGELIRANKSLGERYSVLEQTANQLLESYTQAREETESARELVKTFQERAQRLERELSLTSLEIKKPRTPEGIIREYIASQRTHYERVAQILVEIPETFDPSTPVEQLVQEELERQGYNQALHIDQLPAPTSFEETEFYQKNHAAFLEAQKYLDLLDMHTKGHINLPEALSKQLVNDSSTHQGTIEAFNKQKEVLIHESELYSRQQQEISTLAASMEKVKKDIIEAREAGLTALETLVQQAPSEERQIPFFLQQVELSNVFLIGILFPVGKEMKDSQETHRAYFQNMLAQIAIGNTAILNSENIDLEEVKDDDKK